MLRRLLGARLLIRVGLILALLLIAVQLVLIGIRFLNAASPSVKVVEKPLPQISTLFTPEVRFWSPLINAWARAYKIDPNLIATVIQIESCGDPQAVSSSGAQGLFQVMPLHFKEGENMLDALINGKRGMEYLARALDLAGGDPGLALAGYNGGHSVIAKGWANWSAETRRYYKWGSGIYNDVMQGHAESPTLQEWLKVGGKALCIRASTHQIEDIPLSVKQLTH
jgi:soluble lytic murein transglycosylase-like protein